MKWLWFSLVVAALAGCVKPESETKLAPTNQIPGASGTGGAPVGGGGAGGAGGAGTVDSLKCETSPPATTPAMLHADAAAVLGSPTCNFSSCHVTPNGKAKLVLQNVADLNVALVGKMSCQVPTIPLVAAGGGDTALQNSWLWLKLTSPTVANDVALAPNAAWGAGAIPDCEATPTMPFGVLMPKTATKPLEETKLGPVRRWICAGAPGPM
jgi:hypothetical protein